MRRSGSTVAAAVVAGTTMLAGCARTGDDQETGTMSREEVLDARASLSPEVAAALDSGNAAYRDERYEDARQHYIAAVRADDDVAAVWFGLYMAELALGNAAGADSAMDRARALAPGATLIHPTDTTP